MCADNFNVHLIFQTADTFGQKTHKNYYLCDENREAHGLD